MYLDRQMDMYMGIYTYTENTVDIDFFHLIFQ